ncbi:hypothetical protein [Streptomyces cyslabdanicus]|uniref:hypothetical protein n=1 Tax=Streptomyces cyslabdanicus TaxID=1470456 RepID=UPI004044DC96
MWPPAPRTCREYWALTGQPLARLVRIDLFVPVVELFSADAFFPALWPVREAADPEPMIRPSRFADTERVHLGLLVATPADELLVADEEVTHVVTVLADLLGQGDHPGHLVVVTVSVFQPHADAW